MKDYSKIIKKEGKDPKFYIPLIELLEKEKAPFSINEIAKLMNLTYSATKSRLHKLYRWGIIIRLKRGYYCLPIYAGDMKKVSKHSKDLFFLNGCIRIMGSSNGVWLTLYNSKFGEKNNKNYCIIKNFKDNKCILKKSNKFYGNKLHLLVSKSVGVSISRKELPQEILSKLSTKAIPLKIGIYPGEWDISISELFGTESVEDGQLAKDLNNFGEVQKPSKFRDLKADIIFSHKNKKVPIEVTTIKPSLDFKFKQYVRNSIKSSQILMRFYYSIKWNLIQKLPTILVLHKDWTKYGWIEKEEEFMKQFKCFLIFTDFNGRWSKKVAQEIKRLTDSSLFNKTTPLTST